MFRNLIVSTSGPKDGLVYKNLNYIEHLKRFQSQFPNHAITTNQNRSTPPSIIFVWRKSQMSDANTIAEINPSSTTVWYQKSHFASIFTILCPRPIFCPIYPHTGVIKITKNTGFIGNMLGNKIGKAWSIHHHDFWTAGEKLCSTFFLSIHFTSPF